MTKSRFSSALALAAVLFAVPAAAQQAPSAGAFRPGIYYRLPNLDNPAAQLAEVGFPPDLVMPPVPQMPPVGWDLCNDALVVPAPNPSGIGALKLITPSGQPRIVVARGIHSIARPSLSADCRYVAVQALAQPAMPGVAEDLNIYVIDVQTGDVRRVGSLPWNEESPRFFPTDHRLAYSSFSPTDGVNLHVYDLDRDQELAAFHDIGALQIAISPDGRQFIDPRRMRVYSVTTGEVQADLMERAVASLVAAGFELDKRFDNPDGGFANRGVYPLDATFSAHGPRGRARLGGQERRSVRRCHRDHEPRWQRLLDCDGTHGHEPAIHKQQQFLAAESPLEVTGTSMPFGSR